MTFFDEDDFDTIVECECSCDSNCHPCTSEDNQW